MEALTPVPPAAWPLWEDDLSAPEETLLALGLWSEGASAALELFPGQPSRARPDRERRPLSRR